MVMGVAACKAAFSFVENACRTTLPGRERDGEGRSDGMDEGECGVKVGVKNEECKRYIWKKGRKRKKLEPQDEEEGK